MANFAPILERILAHEGGFQLTDNEHDRGGMTYGGISREANPEWPGWDMIDAGDRGSPALRQLVEDRYRQRYWTPIKGDDIPSLEVAASIFSCATLSSPYNAIEMAQMVLNTKPDGICGPITLARLQTIEDGSAEEAIFEARYALTRIERYCEIVGRRPKQRKWLRGWTKRALRDAA